VRAERHSGFSLTELLVVIAVILVLASMLIVGSGQMFGQAIRLKCQHRLEQIGQACEMFASGNGGKRPRSYDPLTGRRWYGALLEAKFIDTLDIVTCPQIDAAPGAGSGGGTDPAESVESDLPTLLYSTSTGRSTGLWTDWDPYLELRAWLDANLEYGLFYVHGDDDLVPLTLEMLGAASQVWFLNTEYHTYKPGQNVFESGEIAAIKAFHDRGGGIHCLTESYGGDDYYRSANNIMEACEDVGLKCGPISWGVMIYWEFAQSDHPVMMDSTGYITRMRSAGSPAKLWIEDDPNGEVIATSRVLNSSGTELDTGIPMITAWDDGNSRVLVHASYTSFTNSGYNIWPYGDVRRYCQTADKWLRGGGGLRYEGECSYGYSNQLGVNRGTVAADTICIMDYEDWEIDRDGAGVSMNDDDSYIALRHRGGANALMGDGSVRLIRIEEITAGMWTPVAGD
jgi:prepilin-type N-terminal cleavage/methylation domain-containing protein/prepilin-type processing-associated H-X9-DG protein